MNKKIYLLILILGLSVNCTDNQTGRLTISNLNSAPNFSIPIELDLGNNSQSEYLIAESLEKSKIKFILQKSFPLSSESPNAYSMVFSDSIIEGDYTLKPVNVDPIFEIKEDGTGRITLLDNDKPVLSYNHGMQLKRGVPERYKRSTYVHPIYDLDGQILTDDFPEDHYHHRGLSWMWPKVFIDTVRYDLWHIFGQKAGGGGIHQIFENWLVKETGSISATIGAKNYWMLGDSSKVMDEWIYLKVYKADSSYRMMDIKLQWQALVPISIEGQTKKGYGGLNFRFAPRRETEITSKFGREEDSDLKTMAWADQSAKFGSSENFSGVTILQKKSNNNYPAGWCLRHYGFLGVAWPGVERYMMNTGDSLSLDFRILIHKGNSADAKIKNIIAILQDGPVVEIK